MTAPTRREAQHRADDIRTFREELARLESEGVLRLEAGQCAAVQVRLAVGRRLEPWIETLTALAPAM